MIPYVLRIELSKLVYWFTKFVHEYKDSNGYQLPIQVAFDNSIVTLL